MEYLSLDMARTIADTAEKKAIEKNITIVISIYDHHGNLKYFRRMDGTSYGSIRVSKLKAKTSASFPITSKSSSLTYIIQELDKEGAHNGKMPFATNSKALPNIDLIISGNFSYRK